MLAIDLFCGLGGWAEGFLSEGYWVVGFDIEKHDYGTGGYQGDFVMQDVLTIHGKQFKTASVIVASPPCQAYSYRAMPWSRAKALPPPDNSLFEACFRIQREAIEAAGHYIPMIVENVKGAQKWVGRAGWHFGSYYLWGDIPALMPIADGGKNNGGSWFAIANNTTSGHSQNPDGRKIPGQDWSRFSKTGEVTPHWRMEGLKLGPSAYQPGVEVPKGTGKSSWFFGNKKHELRGTSSGSNRRKRASAEIAKIPFPLAQHIARCFREA